MESRSQVPVDDADKRGLDFSKKRRTANRSKETGPNDDVLEIENGNNLLSDIFSSINVNIW